MNKSEQEYPLPTSELAQKYITINVDDLGLSTAVNQAVIGLAEKKLIQSTSFMSLGHITNDERKQLEQLNVEIGLHLDFTGFAKKGSLGKVLLKSYLHQWSYGELKQLIDDQLSHFEDKIGHAPVFIDGHQHAHQFPQIRDVLLEQIENRYNQKLPIRNTQPIQNDFKAKMIFMLGGRAFEHQLKAKQWKCNQNFAGIYNFEATNEQLQHYWQTWLNLASDHGTVIMCHPAIPSSDWSDEIKSAREAEWHWLNSSAFKMMWDEQRCHAQFWSTM